MADIFEPAKRSEIMSRIRGKNTKPEVLVHKYLRKQKVYHQQHYRTREGVVLDISLPRKKRAVFIDGDFWHGRSIERVIARRGENDFWSKKLLRNIERDKAQRAVLAENGWQLLQVWESDLMRRRTQDEALVRISKFLNGDDNEESNIW